MILRILSTLVLWTVIILTLIYGKGIGFGGLLVLLSIFCVHEACALLKKCGLRPNYLLLQVTNFLLFTLLFIAQTEYCSKKIMAIILISIFPFFILSNAFMVLRSAFSDYVYKTIAPNLMVFIYVTCMFLPLIVISLTQEPMIVIWLIATAKFSDVGAYLIGSGFGKHKMSPNISPNKTWEGVAGGIFSSIMVSGIIVLFFPQFFPSSFTHQHAMLWAIPIAICAIMSDLLESVLKRRAGVKDSGKTFPGIGGALDLADSILLTSPFAFLILLIYG